jgi:protein-S-isoprenylcysteine O-methyltransferase Ste14
MRPLVIVWPYWLLFWAVTIWAFAPEIGIINRAQKRAAEPDSLDAGSVRLIVVGGGMAMLTAFPLAWVSALRVAPALERAVFFVGVAMIGAGSLLRRHCWRQLGGSFTGDVRARPDQTIVTTGAYAFLRHPSYSAGILMNTGMGLALGSWASAILLAVASFAIYAYRIAVEERVLLTALGEPYRDFMRTRRRLIPFIY